MSVTDDQLWKLLGRDIDAALVKLDELYRRGEDIGDILNPLREARLALTAATATTRGSP